MSANLPFKWDAFLRTIRSDFPELYRNWYEELQPGRVEGGELRIVVDDPVRVRQLRDEATSAFVQTAMRQTGMLLSVRFICPSEPPALSRFELGHPVVTRTPLNPDYTFEQFVVGASNRLPHASCRAVCGQPGTLYNPLFIHGGSGLGKSHLLQATCQQLMRNAPDGNVIYVSCESFVNDLVAALAAGKLPEFRDSFWNADAIVIDDVQFLANRESSQEELFHTFNSLYQGRKQIIFSADAPPSEIPTLADRLVSRFNWGLVTRIDPPSRETRQAILQKKAQLRGCEIPDDILDFVAERVESNVRLLEGALTKLISETQINGKALTLETAREVLVEFDGQPARPLLVSDILEAVSRHFNVRLADLVGRKRSRSVSFPRQIGMYLARRLTPLSLEEIGGHFGGRDHSTVLHAEKVIESDRKLEPETSETLSVLTRQLLSRR